RLTTPVRADGFDPLGDNTVAKRLPTSVRRVLVAGHSAYLTEAEQRRAIAPRLHAARTRAPDAWIGTEGIERVALAAGGTQFELLSQDTERDLQSLRAAGFEGELAVYAPVVLTDDEDTILDALGSYVARRQSVAAALSDCATEQSASHEMRTADGIPTDSTAVGRVREILLNASHAFALVGTTEQVNGRVSELREAGVDIIVGYMARGIEKVPD
ncbi:MAG TPA: luciferase, partial [Halococcus sp.]|nr:luciferase [Halococcus sp.]